MKKLIIFGTSHFTSLIHWYIKNDTNREVVCFCVNREYISCENFEGYPVYAFEEIEQIFSPNEHDMLITLGTSKMNNIRKNIFMQSKEKGYSIASYIHSSSIVQTNEIGEGNIVLEKCLIQPFANIGNGNLLWDNICIAHDNIIGNYNTISGGVGLSGYVHVGNNCYLGKHSMVHDHVNINDYTLVGAGAYVKNDTDKYSVIVPNRSIVLENKTSTDFM